MKLCFLNWGCALMLVACSGQMIEKPVGKTAGEQINDRPVIAPTDFVIVPCALAIPMPSCTIIAAGGKRVLVGAPAGIGEGKIPDDETPPDAVILLSLRADQIEGLDEVRNRAWAANRRQPLTVAGPDGITQLVDALNEAYVTSDALAYVEGNREGGFNQEAIVSKLIGPGDIVFDTGDLTIAAVQGGGAKIALLINYKGQKVLYADCGAEKPDIASWPSADLYIGCHQVDYAAPVIGSWPLNGPTYLTE